MPGDVVDLAPVRGTHDGKHLKWRNFIAVLVAVLGVTLGVASLFGEWSRVVLSDGGTSPAWRLVGLLFPLGFVYVLALFVLVVMVPAAVLGRRRLARKQWREWRATGLAVACVALVPLGMLARMLAREHPHWWLEYRVGSTVGQPQ